jgi:hypothetical protein
LVQVASYNPRIWKRILERYVVYKMRRIFSSGERSLTHHTFPSSLSQKDLVRRLRKLVHVLRADEDDVVDANTAALEGTAHCLLPFLRHADTNVRLYTVLACIEVLSIVRVLQCELLRLQISFPCLFFLLFLFYFGFCSSLPKYHGRKKRRFSKFSPS